MRIAMIGQKGMPATYGGVERHVHDLAVRLVKAGHHVTAYSRAWYTGGHAGPVEGVSIALLPSIKSQSLDTITHTILASWQAARAKFDVIHYHGVGPSLMAWIPRLLSPHTKIVSTFHSIDRHQPKWGRFAKFMLRLGEWCACRLAHDTIVVSKSLQNYCLNEYNRITNYIPNGTALRRTDKISSAPLAQFGLQTNQYLVMVARLIPTKGAHLLIEAFEQLKHTSPAAKNLKLAIVGDTVNTDAYVARLKAQAAGNQDIVFTGFQSGTELRALYAHSFAVVHPSFSEGLPITVLEAMSYAKPVLVSDIVEHLEVVSDRRVLYAQNSVRDLTRCLKEFLELPASERETIGLLNRQMVRANFSWETLVPQTIAVYQNPVPDSTVARKEILATT